MDENESTLRPGLALTRLNGLDLDDLNPLIIRSVNETVVMGTGQEGNINILS